MPRRQGDRERLVSAAAHCGARLFLTHAAALDRLAGDEAPWEPTDGVAAAEPPDAGFAPPNLSAIAYLQYTSGSTRAPRAVAVSHGALLDQLEAYRRRAGAGWEDLVLVSWLPHTHDFGLVGFVLAALYMGVPLVAMPPSAFLRRPARWLEAISRYRGACCGGPAYGYELCARGGGQALRGPVDLECWRIASLGADHVAPATLRRFEAAFAPHGFRASAWLPAYGLAESVLCATGRRGAAVGAFDAAALRRRRARPVPDQADGAVRLVSSGAPMPGQEVRIVDPDTRAALPPGEAGEIWLAGSSLADGYWNDPAATAAQFHATLAGEAGGTRHLRTGDCGFLHAGELFVTGRLKDVVVVHGENHAPEDVEQTIQAVHPALRAGCGALVQAPGPDGGRVVAVQEVTRGPGVDRAALFAAINGAVTARHGLVLDTIALIRAGTLPRTANGKIARAACRAAEAAGTLKQVEIWHRAPDGAAPDAVRAVEARILERLRGMFPGVAVDTDGDLFAMGVDSLALQRLLGGLRRDFGVEVPMQAVFDAPTASRLAGVVAGLRAGRDDRAPTGDVPPAPEPVGPGETARAILDELRKLSGLVAEQTRLLAVLAAAAPARAGAPEAAPEATPEATPEAGAAPEGAPFPLTEAQREIAMLPRMRDGADAVFNVAMVLDFAAPPDGGAVRRALRAVAMRHGALRTAVEDDGQRLVPFAEPELDEVVVPDEAAVHEWLREARRRPFALDRAPLWRATLLRGAGAHRLALVAHHLVVDGASMAVLAADLAARLDGAAAGAEPAPMQFGAFCAAAAARRDGGDRDARRAYWYGLLGAGVPDWAPPGDRPPAPKPSYDAAVRGVALDGARRAALVRRGAAVRSTLFQTLLCAYFVLLHRVSGQDRLLIGIDVADRAGAGEDGVIGCCNALVPVVLDLGDAPTVAQLQDRLRDAVLGALEHRDYTLAMWAEDRGAPFDAARPFKVTATMNMQRFPGRLGSLTPRFDLEMASVSQSPFGLTLDVRDLGDGVRLDFVYNTRLLDAATVERYAGYYLALLDGVARDAEAGILDLPMLPEAETRLLLGWSRAPRPPAPFAPFLDLFAAQVAAAPLAPAVACGRERLSYRDLDGRADRIAGAIGAHRPRPGTPIGLLAERGSAFLAAMLAILKAGCAYLPLDPKAPDARLERGVACGGVALLLHDEGHRGTAEALPEARAGRLATLCVAPLAGDAVPAPAAVPADPDAPAYVLFTSGSSGEPKAAAVSHDGMANHLRAKVDALGLGAGDVVAQTASQTFDISVWQHLAPLIAGASVLVLDDTVTHDPEALFSAADLHGVTVLQTVPSTLRAALEAMIAPGRRRPLAALRWLISTGEALPAELCRRWISLYPRIPMMNAYGPTECSDDVTHHELVWPPPADVVRAPIGRPIPGADLYVLDRGRHLVPAGTPGELFVGGRCVGLGYLNDPQLTGAAFVTDPFAARPDARLYRTGDLVRQGPDGVLDYLGRLDQQIKINGVRIEPREVEAAIQRDPAVLQCFAATRPGPEGAALVAYVVLRPGKSVPEGTLKAVARNALPRSLLPSAIMFLDTLPLTPNGKIDVAALPEPDLSPRQRDATPPSTPVEEAVARAWSDVIGLSRFGVHDDFFDLGGRSLDAARIIKALEAHFNFRLPMSTVFRAPTVAGMAALIERQIEAQAT